MTIEELVKLLNASLPTALTPLQDLVLRSSWEGKTYTSMANEVHYGAEHLRKVASGLWLLLSNFWEEPITKINYRAILEPRSLTEAQQQLIEEGQLPAAASCEFPSGPVWVNSRFYVSRPPVEALAYSEVTEPGSVIRIKGPRKMGKTSLMVRILAHAASLGYRTASLDFQQADKAVFTSLDKFLRWFCAVVSRELQLESRLENYWDEEIGSKVSCTIYFQHYLLNQLDNPLVLALSKVDLIFEYPEIVAEFLPLLRFWHEQAKLIEVWQKLRLVVAHSAQIYVPLKLNQSPFNVGLPLELLPFTLEQVRDLAQRHGLPWTDGTAKRLMAIVDGHPYLVRLALYRLCRQEVTLEELLQKAPTETGIYKDHLQELLATLQEEPELGAAFKQVITAQGSVKLESIAAYKLNSIGLVNLDGDRCTPSCELYRLYFDSQLLVEDTGDRVQILEQENHNLQALVNIDSLTQLTNRSYFNVYLKQEWQRLAEVGKPLALIMCDLDFFRIYNKTSGQQAGDSCLRQVANAIRNCVKRPHDLVARYGGEEFAVLLSGADASGAVQIAQQIREAVEDLRIAHDIFRIGGLPAAVITVSLGVASTVPALEKSSEELLVRAAEEALYWAKRQGRNQVFVSATLNFGSSDLMVHDGGHNLIHNL